MFKTVVIFGGSGFIGGYIIRRLSKLGYRIIVPTSSFAKTSKLKVMGDVGQIIPISFNSTKYEDVKKIGEEFHVNKIDDLINTSMDNYGPDYKAIYSPNGNQIVTFPGIPA